MYFWFYSYSSGLYGNSHDSSLRFGTQELPNLWMIMIDCIWDKTVTHQHRHDLGYIPGPGHPRDCGYADGYHGANDFAQGKPPPEDFDFHVLQVQKAMPLACPKIQYIYSYIKNLYTVICCFRLISPLCLMGLTCYCRATSKESLLKRCPWEIASASWTLRNLVPIINVH